MVRNIRQTQTCVRQQGRVSALVQRGKTASKLTLRDSGNSRAGICQEDEKGGLINMKRIKLSKGNTFRIAQELFVSVSIRQKRAPSGGIKKLLASLGSAKL